MVKTGAHLKKNSQTQLENALKWNTRIINTKTNNKIKKNNNNRNSRLKSTFIISNKAILKAYTHILLAIIAQKWWIYNGNVNYVYASMVENFIRFVLSLFLSSSHRFGQFFCFFVASFFRHRSCAIYDGAVRSSKGRTIAYYTLLLLLLLICVPKSRQPAIKLCAECRCGHHRRSEASSLYIISLRFIFFSFSFQCDLWHFCRTTLLLYDQPKFLLTILFFIRYMFWTHRYFDDSLLLETEK